MSTTLPARMPAIDGLRGIAILLVMVFHYEVRDWPWRSGIAWPAWAVIREGWLGVDLFFVISGFLITGILHDSRGDPRYFRTFYMRRTLRIFPVYYAYLAGMFLVLPILPRVGDWVGTTPANVQLWFWTYTSNILIGWKGFGASPAFLNHLWSLAVEEQFYLLWPLVVLMAGRRALMAICVACIAGALAFRVGLKIADVPWIANFVLTPARIDSLAAGALVALVAREPGGWALLQRWALPATGVGLVAFVALFHWRGLVDVSDNAMRTIGLTVVAFFFAGIIASAATARAGGSLCRALTNPVLAQVGKYSYAMYVFHFAVRMALDALGLSLAMLQDVLGTQAGAHFAYVAANVLATFLVAAASWRWIESPFLRLKTRFAYGSAR